MAARVIEVIQSDETTRGNGKETLARIVTRYFDRGGQLLAESDPAAAIENTHILVALQAAFHYIREKDPVSEDGRTLTNLLVRATQAMELRERADGELPAA